MWQRYCHLYTVLLMVDVIKHAKIAMKRVSCKYKEIKVHVFPSLFPSYTPMDCGSLLETTDAEAQHLRSSLPSFCSSLSVTASRHTPKGVGKEGESPDLSKRNVSLNSSLLMRLQKQIFPLRHQRSTSSKTYPNSTPWMEFQYRLPSSHPHCALGQVRKLRRKEGKWFMPGQLSQDQNPSPWVISVLFLGFHGGHTKPSQNPFNTFWPLCYLKGVTFSVQDP